MHKIIIADWLSHSQTLAQLRTRVFVEEQQVPLADEWDGLDETATHFLIEYDGNPIGCARLLIEQNKDSTYLHIGRVAIAKSYRGKGLGTELMRFVLAYCKQLGPCPIYLHAQVERQNFYERLGFIARGDVFMDAGIPHISMFWQTEYNHGGTKQP